MKGQHYIKTINHAEKSIINRPGGVQNINFENFYEDISEHWQDRAKRLRMRRWRKIRDLNDF